MDPLDAFFHTVHDYKGGAAALAARMGMSGAVLSNKANRDNESNKPLLVDADNAMGLTNDYRVLKALAHKHGFLLVKAPDSCSTDSDMSVLEQMAGLMVSCGAFGKEVYDSLADGKVDKAEISRVSEAGRGVMTSVVEVEQRLKGMSE